MRFGREAAQGIEAEFFWLAEKIGADSPVRRLPQAPDALKF
jgi:hypothetical protein